ncbi:MAG: pyridoxamine 5'-phosphate oxidase family protein [Clostridia bacterium]|nr:pyridoxamine 5'-phosphate oxidase family protein [Clostridia bacterium]
MNDNKTFFSTLDAKNPVGTAARILSRFSPLYAGTVGLDGKPQVRPLSFAREADGALYFLTAKNLRMYAELSKTPYIELCARDAETETVFRLSGKVSFTEEDDVIEPCAELCPSVLRGAGGERKALIAFFLLGATASLESESGGGDLPFTELRLPDPTGVLVGITIKKKTELRDRLSRVLERREAEPLPLDAETAKLYDGALFVFAEAAKTLWPRMDIQPIERAAVFETWDEREKYTALAARLIGNAVISFPEDITYWLNPETLKELRDR